LIRIDRLGYFFFLQIKDLPFRRPTGLVDSNFWAPDGPGILATEYPPAGYPDPICNLKVDPWTIDDTSGFRSPVTARVARFC